MIRLISLATMSMFVTMIVPTHAKAGSIHIATNAGEFTASFCAANRDAPHVFVLPLSVFATEESIECAHGSALLRMTEPSEDPGHVVMNIDPPTGVVDGFDCDGKADVGIPFVAINCLPANSEAVDHRKP